MDATPSQEFKMTSFKYYLYFIVAMCSWAINVILFCCSYYLISMLIY